MNQGLMPRSTADLEQRQRCFSFGEILSGPHISAQECRILV